jgi:hypothetical protein
MTSDLEHVVIRVTNLPPTELLCACGARFVGPDCLDRMEEHKRLEEAE